MKRVFKILVLFLLPIISFAQSTYKTGYIVNLKGDTINGLIDYREWNNNPKNIRFKNNASNKEAVYSTDNTRAFGVTGREYFERYFVPVSQGQVEMAKLSTNPDTSFITDTVFLRVETKGKSLKLYSYTDEIKSRYFVQETGGSGPVELFYGVSYNPAESTSVKYNKKYLAQLENLAAKSGASSTAIESQILSTNYTAPALIKIVTLINGPSAQPYIVQNLAGLRWFAGVGVNISNLKFTQQSGTNTAGASVSNVSSVFPKINAGLDIYPNASTKKLFIRGELMITTNQYKVTTSDNSGSPASTSALNFRQYNNAIIPQIGYNFYNEDQLRLFFSAGVAFNISLYNNYQYITKYNGSFADNVQNNYPVFSQFWTSFYFKTGVAINNKIEISAGYSPSSSLTSDNVAIKGNVSSFQAGINYLF